MRTIPFVLLLLISAAAPGIAAPMFRITNLGTLREDESSYGVDVNDYGHVTGLSGRSAFLWNGTSMQGLTGITAYETYALKINNRGEVLAAWWDPEGYHGVVWQSTRIREIPGTFGAPGALADLNDRGDVVGYQALRGTSVLSTETETREIGSPSRPLYANAINNFGFVTGTSTGAFPFIWDGVTTSYIGFVGLTHASGFAINNRNQVAGTMWVVVDLSIGRAETRIFVWDGTRVHDLGMPPGRTSVDDIAMNDFGFIVGTSSNQGFYRRPFIWYGEGMKDLNEFLVDSEGWIIESARAISNTGYITGQGTYYGGRAPTC